MLNLSLKVITKLVQDLTLNRRLDCCCLLLSGAKFRLVKQESGFNINEQRKQSQSCCFYCGFRIQGWSIKSCLLCSFKITLGLNAAQVQCDFKISLHSYMKRSLSMSRR